MSFGKIQPTPNFLFHFPSSASSDRKFRNFPKRDTHKLIKCADCQEKGKNPKYCWWQKYTKAIYVFFQDETYLGMKAWLSQKYLESLCCYTSDNGQIEQFINLYKIPLVMLIVTYVAPLIFFHWNLSCLRQFSIVGVFPCSNVTNFKSIMLILLKGKFHNRLSKRAQ